MQPAVHLCFPIVIIVKITVPKGLAAKGSKDILHKKRLESQLSIALLCAKCLHHNVM